MEGAASCGGFLLLGVGMDKTERSKIIHAFELLNSYGIFMSVPGWFELSDGDEAVEFIEDMDGFYEARNPDHNRTFP